MTIPEDGKRRYCPRCGRPQRTCLCAHIRPLIHRTPVHILMHPSELKAAKGTARLTCQILTQGQLWVGETEQDFAPLRQALKGFKPQLLYPGPQAQAVEQCPPDPDRALLLLDGTWRKTHKLLQLNPWLQQLPCLSFAHPPQGDYQIRKAHRSDSLSTLEATAYALHQLEGLDPAPLHDAFTALKQSQLAHMPAQVRARY
ncbi:tRNA-uridine aminocarboxypropyltransferase [Ferrimonas marina]|uniref:tRNA-uridine aminocarboxypropyltransferase n=1 Tax=Ferrimonas marina TaxID=299255 RepID=A0A1M5XYH3_9GAMM|nr:tRNA-uridine aminocarboxypropyltransferase [Ferrimonas marina]SHI04782.1 DTW domain-containing protein YfiP [Ferrimonas marina]